MPICFIKYLNIPYWQKSLDEMLTLDYIIANHDRHMVLKSRINMLKTALTYDLNMNQKTEKINFGVTM